MSNFRDNQLQSNENVMSFVPIVQFMFKMSQEDSCTQRIFTHLFWLTRLVHAMARDGLLFHVFSKIAHTSGVPVTTAFTGGLLTGVFTTFFRTHCMIQTEVFCALLMNVTAPICLLISRYSDGTGGEEIYVGHRLIFINHPQVDNPTVVTEQISIVLISVIKFIRCHIPLCWQPQHKSPFYQGL
uniref:Uncharacterized protein n=1 Tax=Rhodnius prolixus TaxID=13249 RepID=T1HLG7_RHOPR